MRFTKISCEVQALDEMSAQFKRANQRFGNGVVLIVGFEVLGENQLELAFESPTAARRIAHHVLEWAKLWEQLNASGPDDPIPLTEPWTDVETTPKRDK